MSYFNIFQRAYALAIRCNHDAIVHDLPYMTDFELFGVINFRAGLRDS
jgi:hypothetical protein